VDAGADVFHDNTDEWTVDEQDWWEISDESLELSTPSEDRGMGDILYNLVPDPEADPIEEVRELRRRE
jgi:hypothetical protein